MNIKFFNLEENSIYPKEKLDGLLNLCLMKYLSEFYDNEQLLNKLTPIIKDIIIKLRKNIDFTHDNKKNIYNLLKETKGNNILIYSQYINLIINSQTIDKLNNNLSEEKRKKVDNFWKNLSKYKEYNTFFEKELIKDLKKTKFDYSVISLGILETKNELEYQIKKKICPNMEQKLLYHGSQIGPISSILTTEFKYAKKPFYGMGIYFSDIIDYISFYSGGTNLDSRRDNFGHIIPINSTFSFIGSEVFYDKKKFKQIKDDSLYIDELDHFPSYEELKIKYSDKMVEPNGIHFIRVDNDGDSLSESCFLKERKKGLFLGNEYAVTEKYQILPIYSLTVKRNEYFVLWRDPNFEGENEFTDYLFERKLFCMEKAKMNIYFESCTEEALKFLLRRKYNKVIIITSIGLDLSGKRFIEIARKILGFDVMVLFFSVNENHLKWIQNFPNCLYTNESDIYEDYITNFNENGLKKLKKNVEEEYNITLKDFSNDFLSYPNFIKGGEYSSLKFEPFNSYLRHVKIICNNNNQCLYINGKKENTEKKEVNIWDVTILDNEITLFSNGLYLDLDKDNENVIGCQYMKIWQFKIVDGYYAFICPKKKQNNILSIDEKKISVNKDEIAKNELFELIDVLEE